MGGRGLGGGRLGAWVNHTGVGLVCGGAGGWGAGVAVLVSHSRAGNTGGTAVAPQGQECTCGKMSERKGEASAV